MKLLKAIIIVFLFVLAVTNKAMQEVYLQTSDDQEIQVDMSFAKDAQTLNDYFQFIHFEDGKIPVSGVNGNQLAALITYWNN